MDEVLQDLMRAKASLHGRCIRCFEGTSLPQDGNEDREERRQNPMNQGWELEKLGHLVPNGRAMVTVASILPLLFLVVAMFIFGLVAIISPACRQPVALNLIDSLKDLAKPLCRAITHKSTK